MKKLVNILFLLFILLLLYITRDSNVFTLTYSFSIYLLFSSIFKTMKLDSNTDFKMFKRVNTSIVLLGVIFLLLGYFLGDIILGSKLAIVNMVMVLFLTSRLLLKVICDYVKNFGYRKLGNNLVSICDVIILICNFILSILLFKVFKLDDDIKIIILYGASCLIYLIVDIILYIWISRRRKLRTISLKKVRFEDIRKIIVSDRKEVILSIYNASYVYVSIVILYFTLINRFNYTYEDTCFIISNTYFYGIVIFYYLYSVIKKYLNINYNNVKDNFIGNINKIIGISLMMGILLITISLPLNYLLFNSDYNFVISIGALLFIYILYDYIMECIKLHSSEKNLIIILGIGLMVKTIFEYPLIEAIYRIGYPLNLGSIFSIVLAMLLDVIIGVIIIESKFKINLLSDFSKILDIIYDVIIYTLVITLFALVIKVDTKTWESSLFVIIFYVVISILFLFIKKVIKKNKE